MEQLIQDFLQSMLAVVEQLGHWGILLGLVIEILPSEIVLAYGGFLIQKGTVSLPAAVLCGIVGGTLAQLFLYGMGRYGGRPFIRRFGRYVLIREQHLDMSEKWFAKYGTGMIFLARFIPVVRHAISIPAGLSRMPLHRFTLLTALAMLPWTFLFLYLGMTLGQNWPQIHQMTAPYIKPMVCIAIALFLTYMLIKKHVFLIK